MTKICIMGTHQSGSTRLFNLVRLIYEKKGKTVYSRFRVENDDINQLSSKYDIVLCKTHDEDVEYLNCYDIKLLPVRNVLDSALSATSRTIYKKRYKKIDQEFFVRQCIKNINLFYKFKPFSDFVFKYESYSVNEIEKLCSILNVNLETIEIIEIMKELEDMLNSKNIVEFDDFTWKNEKYKTTLLSQDHNTSSGKMNKFVNIAPEQLLNILKNDQILKFLKENSYF